MKALILAGGSGTRLWPLSRKNFPKQFLDLDGAGSLLRQTAERLQRIVSKDDMVVLTNSDYKFYVMAEVEDVHHILLEPASRNTAPAIALGVRYCTDKLGAADDEIVFVAPSDHLIRPDDRFAEYVNLAEKIARKGYIVVFGVKPDKPETGYGYIKRGAPLEEFSGEPIKAYRAEEFLEKPALETAERYLADGGYSWNSGMFVFSVRTIADEFRAFVPEIHSQLQRSYEDIVSDFGNMPSISIDYAIMEKSDRVVVLPMDIFWSDIGSWDSLYDVLPRDAAGNATLGDVLTIDTRDTLVIGKKRLLTTVGLDNCLIVETDDAVLVAKRGETQKVREVVERLKEQGRREASEHVTSYRPWGSYTVLDEGPRYKIKRIVVNPQQKLSHQMHYHRSEHWVVVKGTAKVTIGEKEIFIHENESAYVPKSTLHRLENPGKIPLEMIEVQNGEYVEEDDIVRVDDVYERT